MYTTKQARRESIDAKLARWRLRYSLESIKADPRDRTAAQYWTIALDALAVLDREHGEADERERDEAAPARTMLDGGPDFEVSDDDGPESWPAWTDDDRWTTDEATPLEVLARRFELPPVSGGAPEPFTPSDADWDDYFASRDGRITEADVVRATGCC